jgi:glutathione-specific gamma-glutamylcyclotransferase
MTQAASHWVFAYGSLIWRPDFPFAHREPAQLQGYHRALCVLSHKYRGTPDCLGLVFGLDEGGHCNGVAYEVHAADWAAVYSYLTERELVTHVYREAHLAVELPASGRFVKAMTYVVDRMHPQYAGPLDSERKLHYVRQGMGEAGSCVDYVRNTAQHLHELGIPDGELDRLVSQL